MDNLLPCPFCGGSARVRPRFHSMPQDPTFQVQCADCGAGTDDRHGKAAYATLMWNRRVSEKILSVIDRARREAAARFANPRIPEGTES